MRKGGAREYVRGEEASSSAVGYGETEGDHLATGPDEDDGRDTVS